MDDLVQRLRNPNRGWHPDQIEAADEIKHLRAERDVLKTVMIAAAEEIAAHWDAHCDAEGYGPQNLLRRLKAGIPSEYGYTAGAFAELKAERDALRVDALRYRWLRDCDTVSVHRGSLWLEGISNLDAAIDAAMAQKDGAR